MTAFGGVFRSPRLEGVEDAEDGGEPGPVVGLDLDSGVVRLRAARPVTEKPSDPSAEESPHPADEHRGGDGAAE